MKLFKKKSNAYAKNRGILGINEFSRYFNTTDYWYFLKISLRGIAVALYCIFSLFFIV